MLVTASHFFLIDDMKSPILGLRLDKHNQTFVLLCSRRVETSPPPSGNVKKMPGSTMPRLHSFACASSFFAIETVLFICLSIEDASNIRGNYRPCEIRENHVHDSIHVKRKQWNPPANRERKHAGL
jgi:hypothetical protein